MVWLFFSRPEGLEEWFLEQNPRSGPSEHSIDDTDTGFILSKKEKCGHKKWKTLVSLLNTLLAAIDLPTNSLSCWTQGDPF